MRKLTVEAILLIVFVVGMALSCKEKPGPGPDPTPVPEPTVSAEPTPGGQPGEASCSRKTAFGGGSGSQMSYECRDAEGTAVTCPSNPEALPDCPE